MKLSDKDGIVVDLLLDRASAQPANGAFVKSVDVQPERVQTIQKVLGILNALPAEDPSPDLTARTLRRVEADIEAGNSRSRPPPAVRPAERQPPA